MTKKKLEILKLEYANLIINQGINDIKGKILKITADLDQVDFINLLIDLAYKRGAKRVILELINREERIAFFNNVSSKEANAIYPYETEKYKFLINEEVRTIRVESEDPFWSNDVNQENLSIYGKAHLNANKSYKENRAKKETPWLLVTVPGEKWAHRLFPKLNKEESINKLWEVIFNCCRVEEGKTLSNWNKFNKYIHHKADYLNSLHIKELHYKSKNGTDLILGVNPHSHYTGGAHCYPGKYNFNPNIPANECFISPDKYNVNGIVYSTKPLCRNGVLMEDFYFVIKNGKIIEVHAKKNEKYLKELINTDKNSCYLGEASLVPFDSFINKTGIIFYNTLFDENACCHIAFGYSLTNTYNEDVIDKPSKELDKLGLNQSNIHIDFMIGSKDLEIVATTYDNKKVTIFKNGIFAK